MLWKNCYVYVVPFKKDTKKVVLLQVKGLIQSILKLKAEKNLCSFLSCTIFSTNTFLRGTKVRARRRLCGNNFLKKTSRNLILNLFDTCKLENNWLL